MAGATALEDDNGARRPPAAPGTDARSRPQQFEQFHNYVALPRSEAFRIEYWALEEAKLQRMPAEAEFSRKIVLVVGRRQRHRPRSRAAARAQRRARRRRRRRRRERRARRRRKRRAISSADRGRSIAVDLELGGRASRTPPRLPSFTSAASTASSTPPRSIRSQMRPAV